MQSNETDYYKIISLNIKKLRKKNKLSQEKFAETIECSREYVSRLENNKEKISLSLLLVISKKYGLTPDTFFRQ